MSCYPTMGCAFLKIKITPFKKMWEMKRMEKSALWFFFFKIFIWLPWVLTAARRILIFTEACMTLSCSMQALVPWPRIEPGPLHWEYRVSAAGPPEESPALSFFIRNVIGTAFGRAIQQNLTSFYAIIFTQWYRDNLKRTHLCAQRCLDKSIHCRFVWSENLENL